MKAALMPPYFFLVGEQPGDREDRQGKPFVGPAGSCWISALRLRALIGMLCTLRTRLSISSGSRAAKFACIKNPIPLR